MAQRQLCLPGAVVKKSNDLIRGNIDIENIDSARILAALIACLPTGTENFQDVYRVAVKDFLGLHNTSGRAYIRIREACKALVESHVSLERKHDDKSRLQLLPFFSRIEYVDGVIEAQFNPVMRPYLLGLRECFTSYNLLEYMFLPSTYSQRLFEILKSYAGGLPEVVIDVEKLHEMLQSPPTFRNDFAQFRRRVLEKAAKDIAAHTNFYYEWEPVKVGRSVEKLRFFFGPKRSELKAAELKKAKEEKAHRLEVRRFQLAVSCSSEKKGDCREETQRPIVCKVCRHFRMCDTAKK